MKLKKLAASFLAAIMALSLTGCMGHLYPDAATVDGNKISSGLYLMIQYNAYSEAKTKVDSVDKLFKQKIDGVNAQKWISNKTEEGCKRYVAIERLCAEKGIELNEQNLEDLEQRLSSWDMLQDTYAKNGISETSYRRYQKNKMLDNQLFDALYGPGGEKEVSDNELKSAFEEKNANLSFISIPLDTSLTLDTEKMDEIRQLTKEMLAAMKGGEAMTDAALEYMPKIYEIMDKEFDPDLLEEPATSFLSYTPDESGIFTQEFLSGLKEQKIGDYGSFEFESSILIYEKIKMFQEETDFSEMRERILRDVKNEEYEEYLQSVFSGYSFTQPFGASWFFSPKKIK